MVKIQKSIVIWYSKQQEENFSSLYRFLQSYQLEQKQQKFFVSWSLVACEPTPELPLHTRKE